MSDKNGTEHQAENATSDKATDIKTQITQVGEKLKKLIQNPKNHPYMVASLLFITVISFVGIFLISGIPPSDDISSQQMLVPSPTENPIGKIRPGEIKALGRFVTASVTVSASDVEVSQRFGAGNVCYVGAFHSARGVVEASINLEVFDTDTDVEHDLENNRLTVRVSKPIMRCILDGRTIRQERNWGETPFCVADWNGLRSKANDLILEAFREEAMSEDLLGFAEERAQLELGRIITGMTGIPTDIVFVETNETRNANRECVSFIDD
jgi:hypothetical protein